MNILYHCMFMSVFLCQDPPDAKISSTPGDWFVGLDKAELVCSSIGNPKPQNITWTWYCHQPVCCLYIHTYKHTYGLTLSGC